MNSSRPVIRDLERSRVDIALEVLAFGGLVVLIALPALYYSTLPKTIPQHFNLKGQADGWGDKSSLLMMPVSGVIVFVALTVLARFPHVFNYPWPITEANARSQYSISRQMLSAVKFELVASFAYMTWSTIRTAMGAQSGLGSFFTVVQVPIVFAILGVYLFKLSRVR